VTHSHAAAAIDETVAALYASISFRRGDRPELDRLRALVLPGARFVHARPGGPDAMDVGTFIARFEAQLAAGALEAVEEREIARRTDVFGGIAQRFSTYLGRFETGGGVLEMRGINALQLVEAGGRWLVASLVWDDELTDRPIPAEYLPGGA
jgi:hypothetical protein